MGHKTLLFFKVYRDPILIALTSKFFIILLIAWLSQFVVFPPRFASIDIFNLWNIWDATHYQFLAQWGYHNWGGGDASNLIVFFPFYPLLIATTHIIFRLNFLHCAYLVSTIFSFLAAIMFYKLVLLDENKETASLAVLMLFIFPAALFLHLPYTESLFIFLVTSTFYFLRTKRYIVAFIMAMFATATRTQGVALIPAILVEIFLLTPVPKNRTKLLILGTV